jgi:hypothetical protein
LAQVIEEQMAATVDRYLDQLDTMRRATGAAATTGVIC